MARLALFASQLARVDADRIEHAIEPNPLIVGDQAEVVQSEARVAQLFGKQGFPQRLKLRELLNAWKNKYPDGNTSWYDSWCEQIVVCARFGVCSRTWRSREVAESSRLPNNHLFVKHSKPDLHFSADLYGLRVAFRSLCRRHTTHPLDHQCHS